LRQIADQLLGGQSDDSDDEIFSDIESDEEITNTGIGNVRPVVYNPKPKDFNINTHAQNVEQSRKEEFDTRRFESGKRFADLLGSMYEGNQSLQDRTIGNFCLEILAWKALNTISDTIINQLFQILHHFLPEQIAWPISTKNNKFVNTHLTKYKLTAIPKLDFHKCINDCMVFVGENKHKWLCDKCGAERFTNRCMQPNCKNIPSYKDQIQYCNHGFKKRTAKSVLHYRSLTSLLRNVISKDDDIGDGLSYQKNMQEMSHLHDAQFTPNSALKINL
jgi:hypothetical protein